jgi:hypothetical protein
LTGQKESDQPVGYSPSVRWLRKNRDGFATNAIVGLALQYGPGAIAALGGYLGKVGELPAWGILLVVLVAFAVTTVGANALRGWLANPVGADDIFQKEIAWVGSLPILRLNDVRTFHFNYNYSTGLFTLIHEGHFLVRNISGHAYPYTLGVAVDERHSPEDPAEIQSVKYRRGGTYYEISDAELKYNRKRSDHHVSFEQQLSTPLVPDEEIEVWTTTFEYRRRQDRETVILGHATQGMTLKVVAGEGFKFYPDSGASEPFVQIGPQEWRCDGLFLPRSHFSLSWVPPENLAETLEAHDFNVDLIDAEQRANAAEWADSLIQRERENPTRYLWCDYQLQGWIDLEREEPHFTLAIKVRYHGVLKLVIGPPSGKLMWDSTEFGRPPDCNFTAPQVVQGPEEGTIALTQYMEAARAKTIKEWLDKRMERWLAERQTNWDFERPTTSFGTSLLRIPITMKGPNNETVFEGFLPLNSSIAARIA